MDKRQFIKRTISLFGILFSTNILANNRRPFFLKKKSSNFSWEDIRNDYSLHEDFINLESGYYNIVPKPTLDSFYSHVNNLNIEGSYFMRNKMKDRSKIINKKLSKFVGCPEDELIVTRNTTESLDLIISGYPWKKNDHVIFAYQDYGSMKDMFYQVSKRYGINYDIVSIPNDPKDDQEIINIYKNKINDKTKMIFVSHMINITGQILPIKKICKMARQHQVEVLVDGAHCVGHFSFKISDLGCDYYGSSLHKWLATPLGLGILYVAKKKISKIWPLLASNIKSDNDIMRFDHKGTNPFHNQMAIENALEYIDKIGLSRKESRLRDLHTYVKKKLKHNKKVYFNSPSDSKRYCGILNLGIKKISPEKLEKILFDRYKIFTVSINEKGVKGCRVTPNIFTNYKEMDIFISSINKITNEIS